MSRYVKFYKDLVNSPKFTVRFLARLCERDLRTVMGRTLQYLQDECKCSLDMLSPQRVKHSLRYVSESLDSKWQAKLAVELMEIKSDKLEISGFTRDQIDDMLETQCTE